MIVFGPVPSRRLGRSLGINNIPPKVCSYSCVYCQVGRTKRMQTHRSAFYEPEVIFSAVESKLDEAQRGGESIDYITFVPDGEPTLDKNLGCAIELLKPLGYKIAVITNASLMGVADVREDLLQADWVSLKIDATREMVWRRVNRPHPTIDLGSVFSGILEFASSYTGELVAETMLIPDVNDHDTYISETADFLVRLQPKKAYLMIPIRPPAETWVRVPHEDVINRAFQLLHDKIDQVEYLICDEDNTFVSTGDVTDDLLSITSVHPMRREAIEHLLARKNTDWSIVSQLVRQGRLVQTSYEGKQYYMRSPQSGLAP